MVGPVTYDLSAGVGTRDFYGDLHRFTNEVRLAASLQLEQYVDDYCSFVVDTKLEYPRLKDEYLVEVIITGVLAKN
jgi:hypothetical protein